MDEKRKPAYWAVLPASVRYDPELSPNAKLLYAEISALTGETGYCYASNSYFEINFEWSTRTVSRLIRQLAEKGFIRVEDGDGGAAERRIYAGLNPLGNAPETLDKNVYTPGQNCLYPPDKNVQENNINIINNKPPKVPLGDGVWKQDRFEKLWDFYPHDKRGHKSRAVKAWNRLKPSDELIDAIAVALRYEMQRDEWERGIGIPQLSTYLNGRYWEDALECMSDAEEEGCWTEDPEVQHGG